MLGNSLLFFAQIGTAFSSSLSGVIPGIGPNPAPPPSVLDPSNNFVLPSIAPNDIANLPDFGNSIIPPSNNPNMGGLDFPDSIGNPGPGNPSLDYQGFGSNDLSSLALPPGFQEFFDALKAGFGYSFALGWVSCASAVLACILSLIGVLRLLRWSGADQSYPMK